MASPVRNPKDLKTIISSNHTEGEMMPISVEKLHISHEDAKYEVEMLRSRIDEQGQLICILKKRADEFMTRNKTLDNINKELERLREQALEEIKMENKRCDMLELRFNELAENHEEMIKFKDEHKRRNEILMEQNAKLLKENKSLFSSAIEEKDKQIASLKLMISNMKKQIRQLEDDHDSAINEMRDTNFNLTDEVESLKNEMKQLYRKLKLSEDSASKAKAERDVAKSQKENSDSQLRRENEILLQQVMQRGKLLQERQSDIEKLEQDIILKDEEIEEAEEKFRTMEDRVNLNSRVKKLQAERDIVDSELSQLKREYEAYKVHSNKLLSQEKDLNYKLRKNILS
ncbi:coiled-coil domain-containing protein 89-like [Styela clava]